MMPVLRTPGTKPAPMPWILCGPGWPPASTGVMTGFRLDGDRLEADGLRCLITSPTPVIVPPVPTPATRMSTWPSVSFQISSAVVRRWISGLAGFSNCCGMTAFGVLAIQPRPCDRAVHALGRRRQHDLGAQRLEQLAPLDESSSPAWSGSAGSPWRRHERQADAGVAAGRLDDRVAG